jgi:CubicO group peptidase (beta-lactamase class C family)
LWALAVVTPASADGPEAVRRVDELLEPIRAKFDLPALAVLVLRDGRIVAEGAVGRRSVDSDVPVTLQDRWHLGSDTKAMTATLAAILVERHKIRWDTTIGEAFPRLADKLRPVYLNVTLEQLLWHRGGLVDNDHLNAKVWDEMWQMGPATHAHRLRAVELILTQEPLAKPGEKMIYTNLGYIVAGTMLENAMGGELWEKLITQELFEPLKMRSAGFGAPGKIEKDGKPDNALGHELKDGKLLPKDPGKPGADNPPVLGPAGTVHCTLADWSKFIQLHLDGARGEKTALLAPDDFKKLHAPPPGGDYAMGWAVTTRPWANGETLTHAGSNTMWYCVAWLAPNRNAAVLVATNRAGDVAEKGTDAAAAAMIQQFLTEPAPTGRGPTTLPAKVDLAPEFAKFGLPPRAQGDRDMCSAFAMTGLAEFEVARQASGPQPRLSEEFLSWAANESNGHKKEQVMFYEGVWGLNAHGICPEEAMPYAKTSDLARKPSKGALADARPWSNRWRAHWIRRWNVADPLPEAELLAIKETLAAGHPVACGMRWPKTLKGFKLLVVPPADQVFDGHSIVLTGYVDEAGQPGGGVFLLRNSDGPSWGDKGYGVVSYAYIQAYANDAVWLELGPPKSEVPAERFGADRLTVLAKGRCETEVQDMAESGGAMWARGKQLFCRAEDRGFVELGINVRKAGRYRVRILATAAPDYGTIRAAIDNQRPEPTTDLYCGRVSPAGSIELGENDLSAGEHRIRINVIGKNRASTNFFFGVDCVDLIAAE